MSKKKYLQDRYWTLNLDHKITSQNKKKKKFQHGCLVNNIHVSIKYLRVLFFHYQSPLNFFNTIIRIPKIPNNTNVISSLYINIAGNCRKIYSLTKIFEYLHPYFSVRGPGQNYNASLQCICLALFNKISVCQYPSTPPSLSFFI